MISNALKLSILTKPVLRERFFNSRIFCVLHCSEKAPDHHGSRATFRSYHTPTQNVLDTYQPALHATRHAKIFPRLSSHVHIVRSNLSAGTALNYFISTRSAHSNQGKYELNPNECEPKKKGKKKYYITGVFLIACGVVGYAKYDPDFRSQLNETIPGSDDFIAFVFQEKETFLDYVSHALDKVKDAIADSLNSLFGSDAPAVKDSSKKNLPPCDENQKPYKPPRSAFKPLLGEDAQKKETKDVKFTERRELTSDNNVTQVARVPEPKLEEENLPIIDVNEATPSTLVELEDRIGAAAQTAIKNYTDAICVLRDHADEVYKLVESSVEKVDPKVWPQIKQKSEEKEKLIVEAEKNAVVVEESIKQLQQSIDSPKLVAPQEIKERAKKNMRKVLDDVAEAKKTFEKEKTKTSVNERYWTKVEEARKHFSEEMQILFPNVKLSDKQIKLAEGEIDLFVLYAFQNILFYQKELSKLETIGEQRIKRALEQSKSGDPDIVKTAVEAEIDKEKRKIEQDFNKRSLALKAEFEQDIRNQLKRQADAHMDHLNEAIALKEKEVERRLARKTEEKVIQERTKYKEELAGMVARLKGLHEAIKKRAEQDKYAQQSQVLWSACQTLLSTINSSDVNQSQIDQLKPLDDEVKAISKAAEKDELVDAVVKSIPQEALERGIFSETALRERFLNVERVASIVALVPEEGATLPLIFLSYLQNKLAIKNPLPIPAYELANEPFDPSSLSTFEILQRARFWMDRGDFAQTLRYMNLLQGGARAVSSDWIREAQITLETQQAANVLLTHASASGLVYS